MTRLHRWRSRLARAAALPRNEQRLLLQALLLRLPVEVAVLTLPIRTTCGLFSVRLGTERSVAGDPDAIGNPTLEPTDNDILSAARAVDRVLRTVRARNVCLRRSLMLGALLKARRPILRLGCARDDGEALMHAWLEIDGQRVPDFGRTTTTADWKFRPLGRAGVV